MPPDAHGPFGPIALSLSGGGQRAAGFHLGTLFVLDRLDLLRDVTMLASASGGSFPAIGYALSLKAQTPFADYFRGTYEFLKTFRLIDWAFDALGRRDPVAPSGRRSLVTALAEAWDVHYPYFKGARFDVFWQPPEIPIRDLMFLAVEFNTGLSFRFQKSDLDCKVGNGRIWITEEAARQLRMADIMTASSAIPFGLEPFVFPDDFVWPGPDGGRRVRDEIATSLRDRFQVSSIPLMDGGINDNEGIDSILLALRRRDAKARDTTSAAADDDADHPVPRARARWRAKTAEATAASPSSIGLFFISDAPQRATGPLYATSPPPPRGGLTLHGLDRLSKGLIALSIATILALVYHVVHDARSSGLERVWLDLDDILAFGLPLVLALALGGALVWARRHVRTMLAGMSPVVRAPWRRLRHVTLHALGDMLALRIGSLGALALDVFPNRIRTLSYASLHGHKLRVFRNEIQNVLDVDPTTLPAWLQPTPAMRAIVERASAMATRMWFPDPAPGERNDLDVLVACGQITTCFNLLRRLPREQTGDAGSADPRLAAVFDRTREDWQTLVKDPYAFVPAGVSRRS